MTNEPQEIIPDGRPSVEELKAKIIKSDKLLGKQSLEKSSIKKCQQCSEEFKPSRKTNKRCDTCIVNPATCKICGVEYIPKSVRELGRCMKKECQRLTSCKVCEKPFAKSANNQKYCRVCVDVIRNERERKYYAKRKIEKGWKRGLTTPEKINIQKDKDNVQVRQGRCLPT